MQYIMEDMVNETSIDSFWTIIEKHMKTPEWTFEDTTELMEFLNDEEIDNGAY